MGFLIPLPYRILIATLLIVGAFGYGFKKGSDAADVEIQRAANEAEQLRIALIKEQNNIKERVVTEYKDKIVTVRDKEIVYQNAAGSMLTSKFNLSNGWVYVHDASVNGETLNLEMVDDQTDSRFTENYGLGVVLSNYSTCLQNSYQLIALQSWILKTREYIEEQNSKSKLGLKLPDMPWGEEGEQ